MYRSIQRFNPEAQYLMARAMPIGDIFCEIGQPVPKVQLTERRMRQLAEQSFILPTHVKAVRAFDLDGNRRVKIGDVIASASLPIKFLRSQLGNKLTPVPPLAEPAKQPAIAGRRKHE